MSSAALNSQALSSRMNYDLMSRFLSFIVQVIQGIVICATIFIVVVQTILLNLQWFLKPYFYYFSFHFWC